MSNNVQLRSVAILPVLSHARIIKEQYLRPALEAALGTYGIFKIENWPDETEAYLDLRAVELSRLIDTSGDKIGRQQVKKFDEQKTRFSPEMLSELWQHINIFFQNKIGEGWATHDNGIPGLPGGIDSLTLSPVSDQGRRIMYGNTEETINTQLRQIAEGIRTYDFFAKVRTLMFYHWVLDLGLYETEQPELKTTLQSELQGGRK